MYLNFCYNGLFVFFWKVCVFLLWLMFVYIKSLFWEVYYWEGVIVKVKRRVNIWVGIIFIFGDYFVI